MKSLIKKQEVQFIYSKYYLSIQDIWAKKMNNLTKRLSKRTLIYLLILFAVLEGGYFLYNIYTVFSKKDYEMKKKQQQFQKLEESILKK